MLKELIGDRQFYSKLLTVTLPLVVQQLITSSVQLVDNVMVGRLGESSIASVSVVNQLFFVVILITFGIMGGAGIYSAQYFGSKDYAKLRQTFRFKLLAAVLVGMLSLVLFTLFGPALIAVFTDQKATASGGMDYLRIVRFSILPWVLSVAIANTFRETGITRPLLYISIAAILINTSLNFLLIFGWFGFPALGIIGAAIATLIARVLELLLSLILLIRKGSAFSTRIRDLFKVKRSVLSRILLMALPLTLNEGLWSLGQTTFLHAYSTRGDSALAAINITNAMSQIVFITFGAIATGVAVLVGNTLGEGALEEARANAKKLIAVSVAFAVLMGSLLFLLSFFVIDLYDVTDFTKRTAAFNIRINALFIPVYSFNMALYFILRSGGDMRSTLMMDSGYVWIVMVPVALVLAYRTALPVTTMFLIVQSLDVPKLFFALDRYRKGYWIRNLAIAESKELL
ncbi:MAG: MATE family efflux transporter [Acholeplasmataceae bacterium]